MITTTDNIKNHIIGQKAAINCHLLTGIKFQYGARLHHLDLVEGVLAAEQKVTKSIEQVYRLAEEEDDQPARLLMSWFITEQVEEEATADAVLQQIKMAGHTPGGLFLLDRELGQRKPEDGE